MVEEVKKIKCPFCGEFVYDGDDCPCGQRDKNTIDMFTGKTDFEIEAEIIKQRREKKK